MGGDDSLVGNVFSTTAFGLFVGGFLGSVKKVWRAPTARLPPVKGGHPTSIVGYAALFALVGGAYSLTEGVVASILDHKGTVPTIAGCTAAGTAIGLARQDPRLAASSTIILSLTMLALQYNGGHLYHRNPFIERKQFSYEQE